MMSATEWPVSTVAFFMNFEQRLANGGWQDLYPALRSKFAEG